MLTCYNTKNHGSIIFIIEAYLRISKAIFIIHPSLRDVTLYNVTHSLMSQTPWEQMCPVQSSFLVITCPSHIYHRFWHYKNQPKNSNQKFATHHIVVVVIVVMSTSWYSTMSHATLILYYHASMLTSSTSLISHALSWYWTPMFVIMFLSHMYITCLDITKKSTKEFRPHACNASHCHRCHCCNVNFVVFNNVSCYTNILLSCIRDDFIDLLNIMRT